MCLKVSLNYTKEVSDIDGLRGHWGTQALAGDEKLLGSMGSISLHRPLAPRSAWLHATNNPFLFAKSVGSETLNSLAFTLGKLP